MEANQLPTQNMTQNPYSSQAQLVKPENMGVDSASESGVNTPTTIKRPERLQTFNPAAYGLRNQSISSLNSPSGIVPPSPLPYAQSLRSGTPDSVSKQVWVDPANVQFDRPSTSASKTFISPLDVHFSRPTTPSASRPATPASPMPATPSFAPKRFTAEMDEADASGTSADLSERPERLEMPGKPEGPEEPERPERPETLQRSETPETPDIKPAANKQTAEAGMDAMDFSPSRLFPLPPTSRHSKMSQVDDTELQRATSPFKEGLIPGHFPSSREASTLSLDISPDSSAQSFETARNGFSSDPTEAAIIRDSITIHDKRDSFAPRSRAQNTLSIASSRYSADPDEFLTYKQEDVRHSSQNPQSQQIRHELHRTSSAAVPSLIRGRSDHWKQSTTSQDARRSTDVDGFYYREKTPSPDPMDTMRSPSFSFDEHRDSNASGPSTVPEESVTTPADTIHHRTSSLFKSHLTVPSNSNIGTAIPFGSGLHQRSVSEGSENSIGDLYDAYYRLSTMGYTKAQAVRKSVPHQNFGDHDQGLHRNTEQPWSFDPEESEFQQEPNISTKRLSYGGDEEFNGEPKPQTLYFQSPNQRRPCDSGIPQQLQPAHLQQRLQQHQQHQREDQDLVLQQQSYDRFPTPVSPIQEQVFDHDLQSMSPRHGRYAAPAELDIGRAIVEMQSPLASPTFGYPGQPKYASRVI